MTGWLETVVKWLPPGPQTLTAALTVTGTVTTRTHPQKNWRYIFFQYYSLLIISSKQVLLRICTHVHVAVSHPGARDGHLSHQLSARRASLCHLDGNPGKHLCVWLWHLHIHVHVHHKVLWSPRNTCTMHTMRSCDLHTYMYLKSCDLHTYVYSVHHEVTCNTTTCMSMSVGGVCF